jgi:hypothetical protein
LPPRPPLAAAPKPCAPGNAGNAAAMLVADQTAKSAPNRTIRAG